MALSRKRVLYLALQDPHVPLNGTSARGFEFLRRLSQTFDIDLVHLSGAGQPPIADVEAKYQDRLPSLSSSVRVPFSPFDYFVFSARFLREAWRAASSRRHDYVVADYGLCALYGLLVSWRFGIPLVYLSHNLEYKGNIDKAIADVRRLPLVLYMYLVEKLGVKRASLLVPITSDDARYYRRWTTGEKMIVIPQGVDAAVFNTNYTVKAEPIKKVLFCGNFRIRFNRDAVALVRHLVADRVAQAVPNVRFQFVGAYPPEDIRHPSFDYLGFQEDYASHLKAADVVIAPLLNGRGFPTKIIEALACGKTVVATAIGARSVERDYRGLFIRNPEEFADTIIAALQSPTHIHKEDAAKIHDRYSWDVNLLRLIDRMKNESASDATPVILPAPVMRSPEAIVPVHSVSDLPAAKALIR